MVPANGEFLAVSFEQTRFDTGPLFNPTFPTRLTASVAGIYQITGNLLFEANPPNTPPGPLGNRGVILRLNGTTFIAGQFLPSTVGEGAPTAILVTTLYLLEVGDYVELLANQTLEKPIAIAVQPNASPEFMMVRVDSSAPKPTK